MSRRSSTATRSSSLARAFRSCATISLAWLKSCTVSSSSSELVWDSCDSAALRSSCSRFRASWSSALLSLVGDAASRWLGGEVGVVGSAAETGAGAATVVVVGALVVELLRR